MPLARYFVYVGGALLALLLISNAYLPKLPVGDGDYAAVDKSIIRIRSDRKWPERIDFDTSAPQIATTAPPNTPVDESGSARARQAFAQLPVDSKQADPAATKGERSKPQVKPHSKRKIARRRAPPPMVQVAQQPLQFGFFGNNTW